MPKSIGFRVMTIDEKGSHWLVKCRLNGTEAWMVVDTGASQTVVDQALADEWEQTIHSEGLIVGFDSRKHEVKTAVIGSIIIDRHQFTKLYVTLADLSNLIELYGELAKVKIIGLLGCDFLMKHASSININNRRIYLKINNC